MSFDLPTFEADNVEVGAQVEVQLPDLSTTTGIVTEIATTAELSEDGGDATFPVTVELDDPSVAEGIVDAPVTVAVITDQVRGVTAVPVEALVALAEGGYAVEVADGSETRLVAVEPGSSPRAWSRYRARFARRQGRGAVTDTTTVLSLGPGEQGLSGESPGGGPG